MTALAYRLRLVVDGDTRPAEARHDGDGAWEAYERRKAELGRTACSAAEYERELAAIAAEEGV